MFVEDQRSSAEPLTAMVQKFTEAIARATSADEVTVGTVHDGDDG